MQTDTQFFYYIFGSQREGWVVVPVYAVIGAGFATISASGSGLTVCCCCPLITLEMARRVRIQLYGCIEFER